MGGVLVNLALGELTLRTDDSPNDRRSSENLGAWTLKNHTQNANHRTRKGRRRGIEVSHHGLEQHLVGIYIQ